MKSFDEFINESGVTVQLGCHDLDKVEGHCATLLLSQAEVQTLVTATSARATADASKKIDEFVAELIHMGGEEAKLVAKKFSSSIARLKPAIVKTMTDQYPAAVRASAALGTKIDLKPIFLSILKLVWDEFLQQWQESWLERKAAAAFISSSNIAEVKRLSREIFSEVVGSLGSQVSWFYGDTSFSVVQELASKKNKSVTQSCTRVLLTHDRGCNRLPQPVHPKLAYRIAMPVADAGAVERLEKEVVKAYWPKISALLDGLV